MFRLSSFRDSFTADSFCARTTYLRGRCCTPSPGLFFYSTANPCSNPSVVTCALTRILLDTVRPCALFVRGLRRIPPSTSPLYESNVWRVKSSNHHNTLDTRSPKSFLKGANASPPQGGVWKLRRESNHPLGTRDSSTTGRCVVPVRGLYNPLGPE